MVAAPGRSARARAPVALGGGDARCGGLFCRGAVPAAEGTGLRRGACRGLGQAGGGGRSCRGGGVGGRSGGEGYRPAGRGVVLPPARPAKADRSGCAGSGSRTAGWLAGRADWGAQRLPSRWACAGAGVWASGLRGWDLWGGAEGDVWAEGRGV